MIHTCGMNMTRVPVHQIQQTGAYLLNGDDQYVETTFPEDNAGEELYYCGECGAELTGSDLESFLELLAH